MSRQHLGASPVPPARAPSSARSLSPQGWAAPAPTALAPSPPALTALQDAAEQALPPLQGAAVPAVPPELVLALGRPGGHSAPDGQHGLGVPPAQLPLPAHQPRHVVAHHPRRAHGPHVPAGGNGRGSDGSTRPEPCVHGDIGRGAGRDGDGMEKGCGRDRAAKRRGGAALGKGCFALLPPTPTPAPHPLLGEKTFKNLPDCVLFNNFRSSELKNRPARN